MIHIKGGPVATDIDTESGAYADISFSALEAIIDSLSDSTKGFLEAELRRLFEDEDVKTHMKEVMPYIYAAGFLSFSGREINQENISKTLKSVGIDANPEVTKLLFKANVRSHLVYIYAYYFLLSLGKIGSEAEILSLVNSLGLETDPTRIKDVLAFLKSPRQQ